MSPTIKRTNGAISRWFSLTIVFVCVVSFALLIFLTLTKPEADATIFLHIFLMSFGYLVGLLTGLLGLLGKT